MSCLSFENNYIQNGRHHSEGTKLEPIELHTESFILRLGSCVKAGIQNRVKYASNQKIKGTLFSQLFMNFDTMQ